MDDSREGFWDRLIADWVGVLVLGFVLQGIWFGIVALLVGIRPELEEGLTRTSARLGVPWLLIVALGLVWGAKRAWDAREGA